MWQNGWTRETFLKQLEEKNGFEQCKSSSGLCLYRHNEKACFVGAFIPDDIYKQKFEHQGILNLFSNNPELSNYMPLNSYLMAVFQKIHDEHGMNNALSLKEKVFLKLDELDL